MMAWIRTHAQAVVTVTALAAIAVGAGMLWSPGAGLVAFGLALWIDLTVEELKRKG